jgi:NitT/TauT family transport system permease protein
MTTLAPAAAPNSTGWSRRLREALPPAAVFVGVLLLWEFGLAAFDVKQFLLPRPSVILAALVDQQAILAKGTVYTAGEAFGGLAIGGFLGILVAIVAARWASARELLLPIGVAASAMPIIAMAPLTNIWFGSLSQTSRMAIVAVMVFFPMLVNTVRGLTEVDPAALELMRASAASPVQVLWKLRLPNALPYILTALKIATTLSVIGAVVGEYFGGPTYALGVYITSEAYVFRYGDAWAAILIACALGIGSYVLVSLVERIALPWHASHRQVAG